MKYDYLILGAGPAGLTIANLIKKNKPSASVLVLEKEAVPGGLCRSEDVDGSPLDIGGGHFLDVRRPKVNEFLFSFMPEEEWNIYDRDSRIDMGTYTVGHPFEANIWQMPQDEQVKYLKSIAVAGCNLGTEKPVKFIEWITWKLGEKIAQDYMLPYNSKMFGGELDKLGTYWLDKLPDVSFDDTLLSCLNRKPYGKQPGHARFYYPKKYGYGELWIRMGKALGDSLLCNCPVKSLNVAEKTVTVSDGTSYGADTIITTIPWKCFDSIEGCEKEIPDLITGLMHTGTEIRYIPENLDTQAHWIYVPGKDISYHRILVRHNFCEGSRGYWLETNMNRVSQAKNREDSIAFPNEYTYPLNTIDKPERMKKILPYMRSHNIIGLGRWGEHEHYNSDRTVERAMELFEEII